MSVKDFVDNAIQDNKVVIFSKTYCPYCQRAKGLFKQKYPSVKPVIYELDEMGDGSEIQRYLLKETGQRTVPNIFIGQEHIGGCDDALSSPTHFNHPL